MAISDYMHNEQFCSELLAKVKNGELSALEESQLYTDVCTAMRSTPNAPSMLTDIRYAIAERRVEHQHQTKQTAIAQELSTEADALTPEFADLSVDEIRELQQAFLNGQGDWTQEKFEQSRMAMRAKFRMQRMADDAEAEAAAKEQAEQARNTLKHGKKPSLGNCI